MAYENLVKSIKDKKYAEIQQAYTDLASADIAEFLEELDESTLLLAFRLLSKERAAEVFSYLTAELQREISELVNEKELSGILKELNFDDKVDFLEEMPANVVKKILSNASDMERKLINQFLMYPEYSAGSIMTIEFVDLKGDMTAKEAFDHIRATGLNKETIYTCYVINSSRRLEGTLSLKTLIAAAQDVKIADLMKTNPVFLYTHDDQEHVAEIFKKYDLIAAPVVDMEKRLVGIITVDDIVDVIDNEATEDFYRMAAVAPSDETYLNTGVLQLASRRIGWLMLLMISATFTGLIIDRFQSTLQAAIVLTAFIPILMNTGGNAGSQASTLVIRSLVLAEIQLNDFIKVLWKEIRVSVLVGIVLSGFNLLRIYLVYDNIGLAMTVAITMFFTIVIAKVLGGLLPLIAKKVKLDPAIMSSPVITTIVDAIALILYFSIAIYVMEL
jgi:magnesium transporter